jgi:ATP-dependent Zn protease
MSELDQELSLISTLMRLKVALGLGLGRNKDVQEYLYYSIDQQEISMDSKRKKIQIMQGLTLIITSITLVAWLTTYGYPRNQVWGLLQVVPSSPQPLSLLIWMLIILLLIMLVVFSIISITSSMGFLVGNQNETLTPSNESNYMPFSEVLDERNPQFPDRQERIRILKSLTSEMNLQKNIDLNLIARTTTGFSSHALRDLCELADRIAAEGKRQVVTMHDFERALADHLVSSVRSPLLDDNLRQLVAYHIAGHTLAAWFIPKAEAIQNASLLMPSNSCLDICSTTLKTENILSKQQLTACLDVLLAGRAAEEVVYGDITNYSSNDLAKAMQISRKMVVHWGMGQLGPTAFSSTESDTNIFSEVTKARIDRNVQRLLEERYSLVKNLLMKECEKLEDLAELLCEEETLTRDQIAQVLGDRIFTADVFSINHEYEN